MTDLKRVIRPRVPEPLNSQERARGLAKHVLTSVTCEVPCHHPIVFQISYYCTQILHFLTLRAVYFTVKKPPKILLSLTIDLSCVRYLNH